MRALSFKTGIACLCGTEVKEKFQCECPISIPQGLVWSNLGKAELLLFPGLAFFAQEEQRNSFPAVTNLLASPPLPPFLPPSPGLRCLN